MLGILGIATKRNIEWVLGEGHELIFVGDSDPFLPENAYNLRRKPPANYRFIPFFGDRIKIESQGYDITKSVEDFTTEIRKQLGAIHLRWLAWRLKPDIVHVQAICWINECCALAQVKPLVVSVWGFLNYLINNSISIPPKHYQQIAQSLKAAKAIVVETPNLINKTEALLEPSQQVALIPLGANTKRFCPATPAKVAYLRQAFGISQDAKVILSPRSWTQGYGQLKITKAYGLAQADFKSNTALVFLGLKRGRVSEDFKCSFESIVKEYSLNDKIHFLPMLPYEMMPGAYQLADVIVNYPSQDAFPSTLMEVVACEKAVISIDLLAYKGTFIEDFATLVEPRNPEALARAMVEVINRSTSEQMNSCQQARQVIVEQYEETIEQKKLMQLYKAVSRRK